ncbi:MAG: site-specific integrase, partial [Clostridia bacterium]
KWQNEIIGYRNEKGKGYSSDYLKKIHNQISAIFNHAVRMYSLKENPAKIAGSMGSSSTKEMKFWTKDEYLIFIDAMMDKPISYYAFEVLYWTGIRVGELLALTPADIDFEKKTITINKSYQRLEKTDYITSPKTEKGNRTITIPGFLVEELKEYIKILYKIKDKDRLFEVTKHYLEKEMERGCKETKVKKIRIHDIRHSAVSLLIDLGFSPLAIAERVGHKSIDITYRYAHLFPSKQLEMADKLSLERGLDDVSEEY